MSIFAQKQAPSGQRARAHAKKPSSENRVATPLAHLQRTIGNQAVGKLLRQIAMESVLTSRVRGNFEIRPPGDRFESEADRMADAVLRMGDSSELPKPSAGCVGVTQQTSSGRVLPGTGEPLSDPLRAHFESRFDHDFSGVRVHSGAQAAQSAEALGASAYTAGRDVVFGGGQFAPETAEGKQLLAHELAHVVQQDRRQVGPSIQRRLIITGDAKDANLALRILEPGSGLTLRRDKTGEVSVKARSPHPHSPALETELLTIINDPTQDAEVHVVQKDPPGYSIGIGAFPADATDYEKGEGQALLQQVRIDQIAALEKGAPGAGAFKLAHEIWENYSAHSAEELKTDKDLKGRMRGRMHDRLHDAAAAQGNLVAAELIGPGERKALFTVPIDVGKPPKQILRHVEDMGHYFLVWDTPFGGGGDKILNAYKADRTRASSYTIDGFDATAGLPASANDVIAQIAGDLKKNTTATALFEGFASKQKSPEENKTLASERISLVEEMVFQKAHDDSVVSHSRFIEEPSASTKQDSVMVTIDRPSK